MIELLLNHFYKKIKIRFYSQETIFVITSDYDLNASSAVTEGPFIQS